MKHPLQSIETYEFFLYTLTENFPSIKHSNVSLIQRGTSLARVSGELHFDHKYRLVVREYETFFTSILKVVYIVGIAFLQYIFGNKFFSIFKGTPGNRNRLAVEIFPDLRYYIPK